MKKYEYQVINLGTEIQKIRESNTPRKSEGDEVLMIELLNKWGAAGWRLMNPSNRHELYLEKEIAGD